MADKNADIPEFTDEQLRAALKRVGEEARRLAFAAGRPVFLIRQGQLLALHPGGTETVVRPHPTGTENGASQ